MVTKYVIQTQDNEYLKDVTLLTGYMPMKAFTNWNSTIDDVLMFDTVDEAERTMWELELWGCEVTEAPDSLLEDFRE